MKQSLILKQFLIQITQLSEGILEMELLYHPLTSATRQIWNMNDVYMRNILVFDLAITLLSIFRVGLHDF